MNQPPASPPRNYLKILFLVQAFIAALCCYSRADYNLPLFAFAYLLWDTDITQKIRFLLLFIFTWVMVTILFDLIKKL